MTVSQSPVAPSMSFDDLTGAFMGGSYLDNGDRKTPMINPRDVSASRRTVIRQQCRNDRFPLGFERIGRTRFAGLPVPVTGVAEIALDPVQIGMDPSRVCAA